MAQEKENERFTSAVTRFLLGMLIGILGISLLPLAMALPYLALGLIAAVFLLVHLEALSHGSQRMFVMVMLGLLVGGVLALLVPGFVVSDSPFLIWAVLLWLVFKVKA